MLWKCSVNHLKDLSSLGSIAFSIASILFLSMAMPWETPNHPAYNPNLLPCDFPAFGPFKKALRGEQFEITDQVETFVFNWLDIRPALLYENGMRKVPKLCEKYIVEGDHYLGK